MGYNYILKRSQEIIFHVFSPYTGSMTGINHSFYLCWLERKKKYNQCRLSANVEITSLTETKLIGILFEKEFKNLKQNILRFVRCISLEWILKWMKLNLTDFRTRFSPNLFRLQTLTKIQRKKYSKFKSGKDKMQF